MTTKWKFYSNSGVRWKASLPTPTIVTWSLTGVTSQEREDHCVNDLNEAIKSIIVERNRNPNFILFSTRLYNEIYEQFIRKQSKD